MIIVQCHGCFEIFHIGHLCHLRAARNLGDRLVVSLTSDATLRAEKGADRPVFNADQRREMLLSLGGLVDMVLVADSVEEAVRSVRPHVYCKGIDYIGKPLRERALVEALGGRVEFTGTAKFSSTALVPHLRAA